MATREEVLGVLEAMKDRLDDPDMQKRLGAFTKSLQFDCTDLDTSFVIEVEDGQVTSLEEASGESPDIRVTTESDTLLGLVAGQINPMSAFMSGKIQVQAPLPDLLKLQQLLQ